MGYVYLIEDNVQKAYKIGVTRSNNLKRLKSLQTGNANELKIIFLFETEYPFRLETILHNMYRDYKIMNEWYDIYDIEEFKRNCEAANDNIIALKDNPFFNKNLK